MTGCVGGCLAFVGVVRMFEVLDKGVNFLMDGVHIGGNEKLKQITQIAANVLLIIGYFAAALGMISMGSTLITLASVEFMVALNQAIAVALPYFLGALATVSAGLIAHQIVK